MGRLLLSAIFFIILSTACNKDKFETKPAITIKNINGDTFGLNSPMEVDLEYTDKEGDLGKGVLVYIRNRINVKPISGSGSNNKVDTVHYNIPDFPKEQKGIIHVDIPYSFLKEDPTENDSLIFKFAVTDVKGNKSDTISSTLKVITN